MGNRRRKKPHRRGREPIAAQRLIGHRADAVIVDDTPRVTSPSHTFAGLDRPVAAALYEELQRREREENRHKLYGDDRVDALAYALTFPTTAIPYAGVHEFGGKSQRNRRR